MCDSSCPFCNNRLLADTIKNFVNHAQKSGSQSAKKYYMIFNRLKKSIIKKQGTDDNDTHKNLNKKINEVMIYCIEEGVKSGTDYKEIYQIIKSDLNRYA